MYRLDGTHGKFPFDTGPAADGHIYLELSDDGTMALVARERGKEVRREQTKSIEELMYFTFKIHVNSAAFYASPPLEKPKEHAVALIGKINPDWATRLAREQIEELKETEEAFRRLSEG